MHFLSRGAMLLASVSEKQRTNISTEYSGMAPKSASESVLVLRGYIGTSALLVTGFCTQP